MEADFSGYATKAGLKCSDGRTIQPEAFKHMDGQTVPLVWQHGHNEPVNVLGHAVLEAREDGMYCYGFFNDTPAGVNAKKLVVHKDITSLSIYANQLVERAKAVFHGVIREVSLVLSGANPGAKIDQVAIAHSDGTSEILDDEAVIYTGLELEHSDGVKVEPKPKANIDLSKGVEVLEHAAENATLQDVYDSLDEDQKALVHYMIGEALTQASSGSATHSDTSTEGTQQEGSEGTMTHTNVFEKNGQKAGEGTEHVLTHDAMKGIVAEAQKSGSLKHAMEAYALEHGIDNIEVLFPEARNIDSTPEFISRQMDWVTGVLAGTRKSPFSRIRTRNADITMDEARAKGYIKGNMKKEEFFRVSARTTGPTTVYKKQKLDRDDIIDITDFDVVVWLKAEMRIMLNEELARAILIGDGRDVDDEDKIKDPAGDVDGMGIRSILNEHELYVTHVNVGLPAEDADYNDVVEAIMRARRFYKGSGTPTFYTSDALIVEMLLSKDGFGRRRWETKAALAASLGVSDVVAVEVFDTQPDLIGIVVNLQDYVVGTDRGGEINFFDDFDIDYNQYKYLYETRLSGALVKLKSALIIHNEGATATVAVPAVPTYDADTRTITIPTDANADYSVDGSPAADGSTHVVEVGDEVTVTATPVAGKYFATDAQWSYYGR